MKTQLSQKNRLSIKDSEQLHEMEKQFLKQNLHEL